MSPMLTDGKAYVNQKFTNWADTVGNNPQLTFVPKTTLGVQNVVRYAVKYNMRVRCGGHRFSWSPIFSEDGEVFISFIEPGRATSVPNLAAILGAPKNGPEGDEFKRIQLLSQRSSQGNGLLRIGASVTNDELRRWFINDGNWALPFNTVLADGTVVGSISTMSHGAGREHQTLADQVRRVEYIDCKGEKQVVEDAQSINAIVGSMGLFGVITHITYEVIPMKYAVLKPRKIDVGLAVPPMNKGDIPDALKQGWWGSKSAGSRLAEATEEFEQRASNDYYSEWIWLPFQQRVWVNTWNPTDDDSEVTDYPDIFEIRRQWMENWLGGAITTSPYLNKLPARWQAELSGRLGMNSLPPFGLPDREPTIVAKLPNALHHRRGPANMPHRSLELEIPLPSRQDSPSEPDFSVARRAWWDIINLVYNEKADSTPMRLGMAMRIMGDSNALLAPQRGNSFGTVSIAIMSTVNAARDGEWAGFCQNVIDALTSYDGGLNVRPHWAKEWVYLRMNGQPIESYLSNVAYADQIAEFKDAMAEIGARQGCSVRDVQERFSNPTWDRIIFGG